MPKSIKLGQVYPLEITVNKEDRLANTSLSLNAIELSLIGMTESGLQGITYLPNPQRINLTDVTNINGTFDLTVGKDATAGKYTITPRITTFEKDNLTVSLSRPQTVILDVPVEKSQLLNLPAESNQTHPNLTLIFLRDLARYGSIAVAVTLIAYLVYRKIYRRKFRS